MCDLEINYELLFNDVKYPINKEIFCFYSPKIEQVILSDPTSFSKSFREPNNLAYSISSFVNSCQNRPYSINPSNYYDIRDLSKKYEVKHLIQECNEFKKYCPVQELLIDHLYYKIRKGAATNKIIKRISVHLPDLLLKKEIFFIPSEYIKQILLRHLTKDRNDKENQSLIFRFIQTKDESDESYAEFFQKLDPHKLTVSELKWFLEHPKIDIGFITKAYDINQKVKTINEQIIEHQNYIDQCQQKLSEIENSHPFHHLSHRVHKLKEQCLELEKAERKALSMDMLPSKNESEIGTSSASHDSLLKEIEDKIDAFYGQGNSISQLKSDTDSQKEQLSVLSSKTEDLLFDFNNLLQYIDNSQ